MRPDRLRRQIEGFGDLETCGAEGKHREDLALAHAQSCPSRGAGVLRLMIENRVLAAGSRDDREVRALGRAIRNRGVG